MFKNSTQHFKTYHSTWVKISHWVGTLAFLLLLFTGVEILMVHPRLYWGNTGNDLTPALFELPISRNFQHGGWEKSQSFFNQPNSPVSAGRTYDIFIQNGWGRSLHFLAAWILVFTGLFYLMIALFSGHIKNQLLPKLKELTFSTFSKEIKEHLKLAIIYLKGPQYGLLQKISYLFVIFFLLPTIVLTGLTMSPAVTASYPFLLNIFFGAQSARTIHFFATSLLLFFVLIHVLMIILSGFKKQMNAMLFNK
jgi:thiosulfate reductase cytochrome b subunit